MSVQNELILVAVLDAVCDAVTALLRGQVSCKFPILFTKRLNIVNFGLCKVDKRNLLESLELVLLVIDEVV
jgi:hypothetical protein